MRELKNRCRVWPGERKREGFVVSWRMLEYCFFVDAALFTTRLEYH